jgi:hypothetical protein
MNENDLRDCFAMFASLRIGLDGDSDVVLASAERCYKFADAMLEARKAEPDDEEGIVAIKKRVRKGKE